MPRRNRPLVVLALLACTAVLLPGCGNGGERDTLVVGLNPVPVTLDPHHHNDAVTWSLLCNFYDSLVEFSGEMELQPDLAESWKQTDATHVTFTLRRGVRFAGGEPLRAADVVASFERARSDPRSGVRYYLLGIRSFVALDDQRLVVETDDPSPTLLNRLAFLSIVPASEAARPEITIPNGTGPYRVEEVTPGRSLTAVAWKSFRGLPPIKRVRFLFMEDAAVLTRRFLGGGIDVVRYPRDDSLGEIRASPTLRLEPQPRLDVYLLAINPGAATGTAARALADVRVRRAMLAACDRQRLVGGVFRGAGTLATQYVHPMVVGYDPAIEAVPFDPIAAKTLLVRAGFADGFEAPLDHAAGQGDLVASIVADLAEVGIKLKPREVPWQELMRAAREGRNPLVLRAWSCSTGDASDFLDACVHTRLPAVGLGSQNYSSFSNQRIDDLIEAADHEFAPLRRLQLLQQAQRETLKELPILPLVLRLGYLGVSQRVEVVTRYDVRQWVAAYHWRQ
ncbi:MAG: ABC transporter substrate-binding protein [Thermoanaerobaculales bacterium]